MRYFIGLGCVLVGVALIYFANAHKKRVLDARAAAAARGEPPPPEPALNSIAVFGEIVGPIILFFLGYLALKTTFVYFAFDGGRYLSYFDLGGFLFAIGGYGFWIMTRTKYRVSDLAARPALEANEAKPAHQTEAAAPAHRMAAPALAPANGNGVNGEHQQPAAATSRGNGRTLAATEQS